MCVLESRRPGIELGDDRPELVSEAFQVFECTWVKELDNAQDDKIHYVYLDQR